MLDTIALVE